MIGRRALNRATLARQHLLTRTDRSVPEVVEHLVGLQAQTPHTWYTGLWCRIAGARPSAAADALESRELVRMALMRSTLHLVTARDAMRLRPIVQPALDRDLFANHTHGKPIRDVDTHALCTEARRLLQDRPLTPRDLGALLHESWPTCPPATLAYAARNLLPLVQVPPRGMWGRSGPIAHTTAESWLGRLDGPPLSVEDLIARYLAAFGPASVQDMQSWSGLTRLGEIVDRMRSRLMSFRGEDARELYDLPEAPRPDPEIEAPPRLLYDFDNLLLGHAERSRVITDEFRARSVRQHGPVANAVLVDGMTAGEWALARAARDATLTIHTYRRPDPGTQAALQEEGTSLLGFLVPGADPGRVVLTHLYR